MTNQKEEPQRPDVLNKDVVIIGNGPSGICLSYLLSGNWPHYTGASYPGDEMLTARLRYKLSKETSSSDSPEQSRSQIEKCHNHLDNHRQNPPEVHHPTTELIESQNIFAKGLDSQVQESQNQSGCFSQCMKRDDLDFLSAGLEGRNNGKPLSLLMDQLQHPCLDAGLDEPSLLSWKSRDEHRMHREIDHVVLGKGPPGGTWHALDPNVLTISLKRWMSLPGLDLREWDSENGRLAENDQMSSSIRVPIGTVAAYYKDYVRRQGIEGNFRCGTVVTSVRPITSAKSDFSEYGWLVEGFENETNQTFQYRCKSVVLATGAADSTNYLGVMGEEAYNWVCHDLREFEKKLDVIDFSNRNQSQITNQYDIDDKPRKEPVLVVGSGLSAADAIMAAHDRGIPVVHVYRNTTKSKNSSRSLEKLQWLPSSIYPEYHNVYEMMASAKNNHCPLYKSLPDHMIVEFSTGSDKYTHSKTRRVIICTPQNRMVSYRISTAAVLIGSKPDLSYLPQHGIGLGKNSEEPIDSRSNPMDVDILTYRVKNSPRAGLYAIGPLTGDNFVRFILGGAFGVLADLISSNYDKVT